MGLGFGTEYEILIFKDVAKELCQKYRIRNCLNSPRNDLLDGETIFLSEHKKGGPDLVWNFCEFEKNCDSEKFLKRIGTQSKKYILIVTQNYLNPGVLLHCLYHLIVRRKWDHGDFIKMSGFMVLKTARNINGLHLVEIGAFDIPWFILDVYETGAYFRHIPIFKNKINNINKSVFENWPLFFRLIFAHHHFLLYRKTKQ